MSLKKSHGNMYDWVTHMHSHLAGECPHKCNYCYVQRNRFGVSPRYKGDLRLIENELNIDYGIGKIIFIEHMNDMFAKKVPDKWIRQILHHCNRYITNDYVLQTKNPERAYSFIDIFPKKFMIGTTIESNRIYKDSFAPEPFKRYEGIKKFRFATMKSFITIEPIMDFDLDILLAWIIDLRPFFVNIGADSKNCDLPEPSPEKVSQLIDLLLKNGITIKKKNNLNRLLLPQTQRGV